MDDIVSIESVDKIDQLSFWCLTGSTMLKLIALGVTAPMLYNNNWVQLHRAGTELLLIRGISGSDCVYKRANGTGPINCTLWTEAPPMKRDKFWRQFGLDPMLIEQPGGMFCSLFYLVLIQLLLIVIDIVITAVMCCHYKAHKEAKSVEQRVSLSVSGTILFFYALTLLSTLTANSDFTHSQPSFHSRMGVAFCWYGIMFLVFGLSMLLSNWPRIWMCYKDRYSQNNEQQRQKAVPQNGRAQLQQKTRRVEGGKQEAKEETLQLTEGIMPIMMACKQHQ